MKISSGWWFGAFFPYMGNSNPNWRTHMYQRGWAQPPTSHENPIEIPWKSHWNPRLWRPRSGRRWCHVAALHRKKKWLTQESMVILYDLVWFDLIYSDLPHLFFSWALIWFHMIFNGLCCWLIAKLGATKLHKLWLIRGREWTSEWVYKATNITGGAPPCSYGHEIVLEALAVNGSGNRGYPRIAVSKNRDNDDNPLEWGDFPKFWDTNLFFGTWAIAHQSPFTTVNWLSLPINSH
jgi:hypothetical protein